VHPRAQLHQPGDFLRFAGRYSVTGVLEGVTGNASKRNLDRKGCFMFEYGILTDTIFAWQK